MTKKTNKQKKSSNILLSLIFLIGFLVALYPFYISALNNFIDQQRISSIQKTTGRDIQKKEAAMAKKNAELNKSGLHPGNDPFSGSNYHEQVDLKKHLIGRVEIPKIRLNIPLFDTTNESTLNYGATVLQGTSFPLGGPGTHTVISGHRGLASRILFTNLNRLKKNNIFVLTVFKKKLAYKVFKIQVVKPDNYSGLTIEPGKDLATLLTCTPYMLNTNRLLITGRRVPYNPDIAKSLAASDNWNNWEQLLILAATILFFLSQLYLIFRRILAWRLAKKRFDLVFYRVDQQGQAVAGAVFQLFAKNRKTALKSDGQELLRRSDAAGRVSFENLPGRLYFVKELSQPGRDGVLAGVKKMTDRQMRFYMKKKNGLHFQSHDGELWIYD